MKVCKECNIEKSQSDYDSRKYESKKTGQIITYFNNTCKDCRRIKDRNYNKDNKERKYNYNKIYGISNKENIRKNKREYYINNREKIKESKRIYMRKKRSEDPLFRIKDSIIGLIYHSMRRNGFKKNSKTEKILGCSYELFKEFIENKFKDGMTWENKGEWHLDHIIPISSATNEEEIYKLNHYTNFQPLWREENISKGNKIL